MSNQVIIGMDNELPIATDDKMKILCIEDDGAFDFTVLESAVIERGRIGEIVDLMMKKYKTAKWIIMPNS